MPPLPPASTTKDFSAGSGAGAADDPADRTTYFVADNNGYRRNARPQPVGEPFVDALYHTREPSITNITSTLNSTIARIAIPCS